MSQPIHLLRANKPYNMISQEYFDVSGCTRLETQLGIAWCFAAPV
jgi:hypothetical protein